MLEDGSVFQRILIAACVVLLLTNIGLSGNIRLSNGLKIVSVHPLNEVSEAPKGLQIAAEPLPYSQPPLAGFSPLIAIATSDRRSFEDFAFEHALAGSYVGQPLVAPAEENFVIGVLDTGSVVDLAAGASADILGLRGNYLSSTSFPIGGVSGTIDAYITQPIGVFAAGLGAVGANGTLDLSQVVGHTNVTALASPPIACDNGEEISAVVGTPLLAFYTTVIRVDQPRRVVVRDKTYIGPDIQIVNSYSPSPQEYPRRIPLELGGMSPVTTASYYAFPNFADIFGPMEPMTPTLLSMVALSIPTGGAFFTDIGVLNGQPGPLNPIQNMRVLVDTGAQSSIMSSNIAAKLNLPLEPDFTAQVCGIGGMNEVAGYYVDFVRINAMGGAMEFARVPFVILDMDSPEGGSLDGIIGMNFFWNRNLVLEPISSGTAFLHVSDPMPYAYIDLNLDDMVDVMDFAIFASAWHTTPADPAWNARCDFYLDEVIDARDLQAFADSWVNMLPQ